MKTAIVTDSTAVLSKEVLDAYENIYVVPLQILVGDKVYEDGIDLSQEEFFALMEEATVIPSTSQPSVGKVLDLFEELKSKYDHIIYITISSKISGTYSTGRLAANQVEDCDIRVIDSLHTSVIQHILVEEALLMTKKEFAIDEIVARLEGLKTKSEIYLVVDDLKHLGRTGRVNNLSAVVGALLKIKPILHFEDGFINLYKKVRTVTRAYLEVIEMIRNMELSDETIIMIAHAKGVNNALKVKRTLEEVFPQKDIRISELSPVISVHTGPNTVGVGFIQK
jgi:DegV family protein with EDD domain